ncbi:UDP-N-acetylglucosamine 1-carboxyvinyltransferase [Clostridium manihotivorum]|uniref:UDP-N-acetylglucosamine 1-carboxyvinyltransferase n=1 Tax=Clostridium manihotivorum TaxID=2320868 RepID=A0A3R5QSP4_9CLOT|nr:UDP-N-acetylglucosamine 1-carboxyvinyltransferase [Clostridium manihotivorum]QAA31442.1 UDP-N-acetylglucosamine 1-carboxyvinyltransferase [Clostridium manihotivorum]
MDKIRVKGGNELSGEIKISAAKNSVLPIIAASILGNDKVKINNAPMLEDVYVICNVLEELGCNISLDKSSKSITVDSCNIKPINANNELVKKMRASFLIMGPMLSRLGYCKLSLPGGCNIGSRPIDLHLKGFKALGADIEIGHGYVEARAKKLIANRIYLDFPSVGATENIIMASVFAKGTTIIENAAEEPEIKDLADFLNSMGAMIDGAGRGKIIIEGVDSLKGTEHTPIYDRIEAGTFMIAGAITHSKIKVMGINEEHLRPVIEKLKESGVKIEVSEEEQSIVVDGRNIIKSVDIKTMPYPGFPTDMQAQMMSLLALANGVSVITETVFENRFMHVSELARMGANVKIDGRTALIEGVPKITGCEVKATDLRAGAALIIAGLSAEGETDVTDIYHIDRGYVDIEKKLRSIGADIERYSVD